MKYFTTEELKNARRDEVAAVLTNCAGKNVRYNLAFELVKKYTANVPKSTDAAILDLGVASGAFLKQLYDAGYRNLYAQDIVNYLPDDAKKIIKEFKTVELNTEKLPWADKAFDIVTAWCVLPHLENPFFAGREAARVLKSGGYFLFSAPNMTSAGAIEQFLKIGYFGSFRPTNNHIAMLPPTIVEKTFQKYGFELVDTDYLVIPKIFYGFKGSLRSVIYKFADSFPRFKRFLKHRWGYNTVYILKKQ